MSKVIFGIDYGSKLTGNTVIAIFNEGEVFFMDIDKGVDADMFILNAAEHFKPSKVFIDAPLSLPGVYRNLPGCENYHFRKADLELKAMSPMFLGGLAARAIELSTKLSDMQIDVYETYPRILANRLKLKLKGYKGSKMGLKDCTKEVLARLKNTVSIKEKQVRTWHHLDSLLALISAMNHIEGESETYGDSNEGLIYI